MLVLLEIDGTLVDTNYLNVEAWARALHELGLVVTRAAIHRQIGKGTDQFLPVFVKDAGSKYAKELQKNIFPLPGARELIEAEGCHS